MCRGDRLRRVRHLRDGRSESSFTTIKYDFNGVQQWVRSYNGTGNSTDAPADLIMDAAGNIYVTGQSTGDGTNHEYATIKYDAAGTEQWVRRYDGPTTVFANDYDVPASRSTRAAWFVTGNSSDDFATSVRRRGYGVWVRRYNGPGPAPMGNFDRSRCVRQLLRERVEFRKLDDPVRLRHALL
jgi:hypothetical protein